LDSVVGRIGKILARLLNAVPAEEMEGIRLRGLFWEVEVERLDHAAFLRRLPDLVSNEAVLVLEGGAHPVGLRRFLEAHAVPAQANVARGTVWPRATVFHVPTRPPVLSELGDLAENCAAPEICDHLHVYKDDQVLLEWYDTFSNPFFISKQVPEQRLGEFCRELSVKLKEGDEGAAELGVASDVAPVS
jgi:hypothetical protein